jgi:DNA-binding GntR family transcriptional regulator
MAVRLCSARMTDTEVQQLWECIKEHKQTLEKKEMETAADLDLHFHVMLLEGARSPVLEQQAKGILIQTRRLSQLYVYGPESALQFIAQHTDIYQAIHARDAEAAERAVSFHIDAIKKFQQEKWHLLF